MSTAPNAVAAIDVRNVTALPITTTQPDFINPTITNPTANNNTTFDPVGDNNKIPFYSNTTTSTYNHKTSSSSKTHNHHHKL